MENKRAYCERRAAYRSQKIIFANLLPYCHTSLESPLYKGLIMLWQQRKVWQQKGI